MDSAPPIERRKKKKLSEAERLIQEQRRRELEQEAINRQKAKEAYYKNREQKRKEEEEKKQAKEQERLNQLQREQEEKERREEEEEARLLMLRAVKAESSTSSSASEKSLGGENVTSDTVFLATYVLNCPQFAPRLQKDIRKANLFQNQVKKHLTGSDLVKATRQYVIDLGLMMDIEDKVVQKSLNKCKKENPELYEETKRIVSEIYGEPDTSR